MKEMKANANHLQSAELLNKNKKGWSQELVDDLKQMYHGAFLNGASAIRDFLLLGNCVLRGFTWSLQLHLRGSTE